MHLSNIIAPIQGRDPIYRVRAPAPFMGEGRVPPRGAWSLTELPYSLFLFSCPGIELLLCFGYNSIGTRLFELGKVAGKFLRVEFAVLERRGHCSRRNWSDECVQLCDLCFDVGRIKGEAERRRACGGVIRLLNIREDANRAGISVVAILLIAEHPVRTWIIDISCGCNATGEANQFFRFVHKHVMFAFDTMTEQIEDFSISVEDIHELQHLVWMLRGTNDRIHILQKAIGRQEWSADLFDRHWDAKVLLDRRDIVRFCLLTNQHCIFTGLNLSNRYGGGHGIFFKVAQLLPFPAQLDCLLIFRAFKNIEDLQVLVSVVNTCQTGAARKGIDAVING